MVVRVLSASCKRSGYTVIDNISFELSSGQIGLISGSNGSGKTSLLRMVAGLIPLTSGNLLFSPSIDQNSEHSDGLFLLGHSLAIKDDISPEEDIKFWSSLLGRGYHEDVLLMVGLSNLKKIPCKYLSQGQKQRLGIARLIASNKSLWLLDEPTSSLDKTASLLLKEIIEKHTKSGGIALISSHINFLDKTDIKIDLDSNNVSS
ncbi:heme ABC exporter ATP-binding protein CcmA [Hyphomicrobiales bacterium]|jgi:heme exporter protein A|nr:heme ABC exporter ATP-binding protein CcmA [Hyphomicrobiales bacterium]MDB9925967.1 heme ABC exporter ATP-binding protein CcmA [Hyphomicrobiales bacterium]|tara:strand:+ start:1782 stop:2393 length:612 start_codon:yes stop_codon:yes gene_type:complete